jgi:hypothetical protein
VLEASLAQKAQLQAQQDQEAADLRATIYRKSHAFLTSAITKTNSDLKWSRSVDARNHEH